MGLALPLALAALGLLSVPLWIHRVRKRLMRDQRLPTIALLQRASRRKRRSLSFLDRPLLLVRLALVALFALALARPYLSRMVSYATGTPVAVAIVIDDSMSMNRRATAMASALEAATSRAREVLAELAPNSEVAVVLGGKPPRILGRRTTDLGSLRDRLDAAHSPSARGGALSEAVGLALRELTGSRLALKEVLVLSDCAAHAGTEALTSSASSLRVECITVDQDEPNAYITSLDLMDSRQLDAPALLTVGVASSTPDQRALALAIRVDDETVRETEVALTEGKGLAEISLPAPALRRGRALTAQIETPNAIREDDVRVLPLGNPSELSVLVVDGDPASNQFDDEVRFLALALSLDDGLHGAPRVVRIDGEGLETAEFTDFDVVILANVRPPSEATAEHLERYVQRGGGLLISAGDHVDAFGYRGVLGALLPALPRSSAPASPALAVAVEQTLRSDLVPDAARGLETARTSQRLLVEPPVAPNTTLIAFADGTPLLVGGRYGRGKLALLTTSVDDDWTDLPLTPGFLPLIQGLVRGLSAVDALPHGPHPAGTALQVRVPLGARAMHWITPDGRRLDVDTDQRFARVTDTGSVGVYRAFAALEDVGERELTQMSFTVVADTSDSDVAPGAAPARDALPEQTSIATPRGVENWFWLVLGLIALVEGLVRSPPAAQRQPG